MRPFEPMLWEELPDGARAALPRDAAPPARLAIARSLVPLGTRDLVTALYYLSNDEDRRVRAEARRSLTSLPETMLPTLLAERLSPKVLNWFATRDLPDSTLYEAIALNRSTADETIAHLAESRYEERLLNIIANNQERLLRSSGILGALLKNEAAPLSLTERVRSFVEMTTGRPIEEFLAAAPAVAEPEPTVAEAAAPAEAAEESSPADVAEPIEAAPVPEAAEGEEAEEYAPEEPAGGKAVDVSGIDVIADEELPSDFDLDKLVKEVFAADDHFAAEFVVDIEDSLSAQQVVSLANRIRKMTVLDKMRLGLKGNMEARQILLKSSNKMVQECVLRNPRLTVEEIIKVAKDKTFREELIRVVANNKDWIKHYPVVSSLCWNPKTPLTLALKYLPRLNIKDLEKLSKSKQIAGMLAVQARKAVAEKRKNR